MLVSIVTAFTLLVEAMGAVVVARSWHLTWWAWHFLMAAGFGFVSYSAYVQYRREGSASGLFNATALEQTVRSIRAEYAGALESLTSALSRQEEDGWSEEEMELITAGLASRSPDVATAFLADPSQAALGGAVVEVSALFADLRGFTSFSEHSLPEEIVAMLNCYFSLAVPCVLARGGTVVQFVGDAMLALFNAPARQGNHALRAAQAALEIQNAIEALVADNPGWPRFRVGINTGPALVGNIGSDELRGFNAMGDAVNVASRLQSMARPGQVVIGASTYAAIWGRAEVQSLGEFPVKGRQGWVGAYVLTALGEAAEEAPDLGETATSAIRREPPRSWSTRDQRAYPAMAATSGRGGHDEHAG